MFENKTHSKAKYLNEEKDVWISINNSIWETALCMDWEYYIIMWDFEKELTDMNDIEEVKKFFKDKENLKGFWSNDFTF